MIVQGDSGEEAVLVNQINFFLISSRIHSPSPPPLFSMEQSLFDIAYIHDIMYQVDIVYIHDI